MKRAAAILGCIVALAPAAIASADPLPAEGTVQVAFTPGSGADRMIIDVIAQARRQVLVQAFSFTHRRVADALVAAHRRGVDVAVIADRGQALHHSRRVLELLVAAGVPLLLDGAHDAAHSKVIIADAGEQDCAVVTGSFNFSYAAQHRNAENVLVLRAHRALCDAYAREWQRHAPHSRAYRAAR